MSFSHSFSEDFYGSEDEAVKTRNPTTVWDAIASLSHSFRVDLAEHYFDKPEPDLTDQEIFDAIRSTDTVTDLSSPIEVWIDEEGEYTITVSGENPTTKGTVNG